MFYLSLRRDMFEQKDVSLFEERLGLRCLMVDFFLA